MIIRKLENFHQAKMQAKMQAKVFASICALFLAVACGGSGGSTLPSVSGFTKVADIQASLTEKLTRTSAGDALPATALASGNKFADDIRWILAGGGEDYKDLPGDDDGYVTESAELTAKLSPATIDQLLVWPYNTGSNIARYKTDVLDLHNANIVAQNSGVTMESIEAQDTVAENASTASNYYFWDLNDATNPQVSIDNLSPSLVILDSGGYFGTGKQDLPTASFALRKRIASVKLAMAMHVTFARGDKSLNFYVPLRAVGATSSTDEASSGAIASNLIDDAVTGKQKRDPNLYVFRTTKYGIYGAYRLGENQLFSFALGSSNSVYTRTFETGVTNGELTYIGRFIGVAKATADGGYDTAPSYGWIEMKANFATGAFVADLGFEISQNNRFAKITNSADFLNGTGRVYADQVNGTTVAAFNTIRYTGQVSSKDDTSYIVNFGGSLDAAKHSGGDAGSIAGTFNGPLAEDATGVFRYEGSVGGAYRYIEGSMGATR